jgi:hypothetical protein
MKKLILGFLICSIISCTAPKRGCKSTWDMSGYGFMPTPTQLQHQSNYGYLYCPETCYLIITRKPEGNIVAGYFINK